MIDQQEDNSRSLTLSAPEKSQSTNTQVDDDVDIDFSPQGDEPQDSTATIPKAGSFVEREPLSNRSDHAASREINFSPGGSDLQTGPPPVTGSYPDAKSVVKQQRNSPDREINFSPGASDMPTAPPPRTGSYVERERSPKKMTSPEIGSASTNGSPKVTTSLSPERGGEPVGNGPVESAASKPERRNSGDLVASSFLSIPPRVDRKEFAQEIAFSPGEDALPAIPPKQGSFVEKEFHGDVLRRTPTAPARREINFNPGGSQFLTSGIPQQGSFAERERDAHALSSLSGHSSSEQQGTKKGSAQEIVFSPGEDAVPTTPKQGSFVEKYKTGEIQRSLIAPVKREINFSPVGSEFLAGGVPEQGSFRDREIIQKGDTKEDVDVQTESKNNRHTGSLATKVTNEVLPGSKIDETTQLSNSAQTPERHSQSATTSKGTENQSGDSFGIDENKNKGHRKLTSVSSGDSSSSDKTERHRNNSFSPNEKDDKCKQQGMDIYMPNQSISNMEAAVESALDHELADLLADSPVRSPGPVLDCGEYEAIPPASHSLPNLVLDNLQTPTKKIDPDDAAYHEAVAEQLAPDESGDKLDALLHDALDGEEEITFESFNDAVHGVQKESRSPNSNGESSRGSAGRQSNARSNKKSGSNPQRPAPQAKAHEKRKKFTSSRQEIQRPDKNEAKTKTKKRGAKKIISAITSWATRKKSSGPKKDTNSSGPGENIASAKATRPVGEPNGSSGGSFDSDDRPAAPRGNRNDVFERLYKQRAMPKKELHLELPEKQILETPRKARVSTSPDRSYFSETRSLASVSSLCTVSEFTSPRRTGKVGCQFKFDPFVHQFRAPCELCVFFLTDEEREALDATGRHVRVMYTRGGCCGSCEIFPRPEEELPVRLCRTCFFNTHRQVKETNASRRKRHARKSFGAFH